MMKTKRFRDKFDALENQVYELEQLVVDPEHLKEILVETFEKLRGSLEEFRVAEEEIQQQNEELITAQETLESERQRYKELFEFTPDGYLMTDTIGTIKEANLAAADLLSVHQEFLIGVPLTRFASRENRRDFYNLLNQMRKLDRIENREIEFHPRGDASFPALITVAAVRNPQGKPIGLLWSIRDITERKKMEEERLRLSKLESLGVLAGGIAHDFNNMLAGILTTISLAKMDTHSGTKMYENLTDAEKACLQTKGLTQQLLTFSGGGTPVKNLVSMEELIRDTASFALRSSSARCEISIEEGLWDVEVDQQQIAQVITNLLINADQAMLEGGVIRIIARNVNQSKPITHSDAVLLKEGRYVRITVEDKGIGIPKEYFTRIFDPYFTTKKRRSGLGLSTAYSIVKNHNGYIGMESEPGKGTKFYVYIPASDRRVEQTQPEVQKILSGRGRVLIMDDEVIIRKAVGNALSRIGYEVEHAKDGNDVINLYKEAKKNNKPFDVIIMDLTVPGGMGGKETIKRLMKVDSEVKAIVSSGYSNDPVMSEFRKYGFRGVVPKPYNIEELNEAIHKVIND